MHGHQMLPITIWYSKQLYVFKLSLCFCKAIWDRFNPAALNNVSCEPKINLKFYLAM